MICKSLRNKSKLLLLNFKFKRKIKTHKSQNTKNLLIQSKNNLLTLVIQRLNNNIKFQHNMNIKFLNFNIISRNFKWSCKITNKRLKIIKIKEVIDLNKPLCN